jgi:predicted nucleic acid-binding protein
MATTDEVICDAGPLIHLDELSALDLLTDFSAVIVPQAVWAEVERHRSEALTRVGVNLLQIAVQVEADPAVDTLIQTLSLGAGEQAAIRLARQRPNAILLTDDAAARLAAEGLGLRVHGTLGILIRAVRRGQRTSQAVIGLLESLPTQSSLHIRAEFLAGVVNQLRTEYGSS